MKASDGSQFSETSNKDTLALSSGEGKGQVAGVIADQNENRGDAKMMDQKEQVKMGTDANTEKSVAELAVAKKTAKNKKKKESARKNKAAAALKETEDNQRLAEIGSEHMKKKKEAAALEEAEENRLRHRVIADRQDTSPLFEVKTSPGMGMRLFATRDIEKGRNLSRGYYDEGR